MASLWNWLADATLAVLLAAVLVMAFRLDRALRIIRRDRAVFETLISNLDAATGSVKSGIQALRSEAEHAAGQIERRTMEADKMATDLSFLVESADRIGTRLEHTLRSASAALRMEQSAPDVAGAAPSEYRDTVDASVMPTASVTEYRPAFWPGLSNEAGPALPAEQPGSRSQSAEAAAETGPTASPDDLREMAGITTRRPQRTGDAGLHAGPDVGTAFTKLAG